MLAELKTKYDERARISARMDEILRDCQKLNAPKDGEQKRTFTAEEQVNWDKAWSDYRAYQRQEVLLDAEIEAREKHEIRQQLLAASKGLSIGAQQEEDNRARDAFWAYCRRGYRGLEQEQRDTLKELRAQSTADGSGGYLTHPEFSNRIAEAMRAVGGVRPLAQVIVSSTGSQLLYPMIDDTAVVAGIIGEGAQVTLQDFADQQKAVDTYKYSTRFLVSEELLQDNLFDLEALMLRLTSRRMERGSNLHFTTGNGTSQPQGFIGDAPDGHTAAGATAIAYADLISLLHSVDPSYRVPGETYWMMHDAVLGVVRQITDSAGNAIWQLSAGPGIPDTLLGYPIQINQNMASTVATTNKTVAFGNWMEGYLVRDVMPLTFRRLDELYAENGQVGFVAHMRIGGETLFANATTYAPIKLLAQP